VSRARAAGERIPLDSYQTPPQLAIALCERVRVAFRPLEIVEPSAGSGSFVYAARLVWPDAHVTANDVDRGRRRELLQAGAHVVLHGEWEHVARTLASNQREDVGGERLVVGNPPFRLAERHVEAGLEWLRAGDRLAFLLRLNLLGSTRRLSFWGRPGLASVAPIVPRPSFTGGGTDGTEYALFTWVKGYRGPARLQRPIVWKPVRRRP
jgi:hypothetical protein